MHPHLTFQDQQVIVTKVATVEQHGSGGDASHLGFVAQQLQAGGIKALQGRELVKPIHQAWLSQEQVRPNSPAVLATVFRQASALAGGIETAKRVT